MPKIMLVGAVGCGKSTLCRAIEGLPPLEKKTQAIEALGSSIDTPGEYLEIHRLHRALAVTAAQADLILLICSCTCRKNHFPAGFISIFGEKPVCGIISKADMAHTRKDIATARKTLSLAGVQKILTVSAKTGQGLDLLQREIMNFGN